MSTRMMVETRRQQILQLLDKQGQVTVEALSTKFDLSAVTIRNDLETLSQAGLLIRSHGGAVKGQVNQHEVHLGIKETLQREEKLRIAEYAASLVVSGDTIALDSGSTTFQIAHALHARKLESLTVITNALNTAVEVSKIPNARLIMLGGILRQASLSLVGPHAEDALRTLNADRVFIAADGIDLEVGLSTPDVLEAELSNHLIAAAREVYVVIDSTKFGRRSLSVISPLQKGFKVITDKNAPDNMVCELRDRDIDVTLV